MPTLSPSVLAKELFSVANGLFSTRGEIRVITTDAINDAYEGFAARLGPIPAGNRTAYGLVKALRDTAQEWDWALGRFAEDLEWLGRTINRAEDRSKLARINLRTSPLGEGVSTEEFASALIEGSRVLLSSMRPARDVVKKIKGELKDTNSIFQTVVTKEGINTLLERAAVWEKTTKQLSEEFKGLAMALKSKTASIHLFNESLIKLARYEEGVPADPTENMSPEDAAEWRRQNEEHKDNFKAAMWDDALVKLGATKKPTFAEVRKNILEHLKKEGWDVKDNLKVPHATSPDGKTRLWFKTQAVYGAHYETFGGAKLPKDIGDAQSWSSDIRDEADPKDFMKMIERWERIKSKS